MSARPDFRLPPQDARLWSEDKEEKFDTPLDERGLVDLDQLVALGRRTVVSGYDWTSSLNDVHHLQWPAVQYNNRPESRALDFRGLIQRQAFIPRQFHNWLHLITAPPPIPDEEVMHYCIEAEQSARNLAKTTRLAVKLGRIKAIPKDELQKRLKEEFDNYQLYVKNARLVPIEFRLLQLAEIEADNVDEMIEANRKLGKLALYHVPIRLRALRAT